MPVILRGSATSNEEDTYLYVIYCFTKLLNKMNLRYENHRSSSILSGKDLKGFPSACQRILSD